MSDKTKQNGMSDEELTTLAIDAYHAGCVPFANEVDCILSALRAVRDAAAEDTKRLDWLETFPARHGGDCLLEVIKNKFGGWLRQRRTHYTSRRNRRRHERGERPAMTDEQMRVKIAEACGWREIEMRKHPVGGRADVLSGKFGSKEYVLSIPDYPNDLNACHEMEKVLTTEQRSDYSHALAMILCINFTGNKCMYDSIDQFTQLHATARQRCEAFLRTIGQWEELQVAPQSTSPL